MTLEYRMRRHPWIIYDQRITDRFLRRFSCPVLLVHVISTAPHPPGVDKPNGGIGTMDRVLGTCVQTIYLLFT